MGHPIGAGSMNHPPIIEILRCTHSIAERRVQTYSNGSTHHCMQCQACGAKVGGSLPKDGKSYPPFDKGLVTEGDATPGLNVAMPRQDWKDWYAEYLASPEWRERRLRVFARDRNLCQGCLVKEADVVHHTTYEHVGDELLYELVSLCKACHNKAHGKDGV